MRLAGPVGLIAIVSERKQDRNNANLGVEHGKEQSSVHVRAYGVKSYLKLCYLCYNCKIVRYLQVERS